MATPAALERTKEYAADEDAGAFGDGAAEHVVVGLAQHEALRGVDEVVLARDGTRYARLDAAEARDYRLRTRFAWPTASAAAASVAWALLLAGTAGTLLQVHAANLVSAGGRWTEVALHWPSLLLILVGVVYVYGQAVPANDARFVHALAGKLLPLFFVVASAAHGMYYNDEWCATPRLAAYAGAMGALFLLGVGYALLDAPRAESSRARSPRARSPRAKSPPSPTDGTKTLYSNII